jgi:sulfide:quinone oxidoreductase
LSHDNRTGAARVVVLGGGFAGLETAFSLANRLGRRSAITLVSDRDDFLFKPNTIYIPFGADPTSLLIPLARPAGKRDIHLIRGTVASVDPDRQRVHLNGEHLAKHLRYDFLVVATGAAMAPGEVPGMAEYAEMIWTPEEMLSLRARIADVVARASRGERQTVLFAVPPNNKCAGPLYEIVFMLETWLRRRKVREQVELLFTTYEQTFIQAFGPKLDGIVRDEFAAREITGHLGERLAHVEPAQAVYESGRTERYDLLIAFPPYVGAVRYPGLPSDDRGFLSTDLQTRRVDGQERVYAPGDAGDFPVKQAFLAFLQADAAADDITGQILGAAERRASFDPVSMCVMEELDKATFAQVPLELTGDSEHPVAVRADANGAYRVGVSPIWRLGKKALGIYLPIRFKAGRPFHAGAPWAAMNTGLRVMSALLARK